VLERVLDFLAIIGTFAVTLQFIPLSPDLEMVRKGGYVIGGASLAAFLVFLAFVWQTERCLRIAEWTLGFLPHRTRERSLHLLRLGIEGLYVLRNPRVFPLLVGLTLVHWSMNGLGLYLAAISIPTEQPVPILASFFLLSVCALGVTLPSAPGYVGTIQYCFVLALGVFGIQREPALAASVYSLFLGHVPVTLVGFYYLGRLGLMLGSLRREAEEDREEA
jgi:hypothetical protein